MADMYEMASAFLAAIDTDWQRHVSAVGPCLHQPHPARDPYESLVRAIAYQQLHAKAGDAILGRLMGLFPGQSFPRPQQILATRSSDCVLVAFQRARSRRFKGLPRRRWTAWCPITRLHGRWTMKP
jgi:DNA-3-methyladenine glycosylase II